MRRSLTALLALAVVAASLPAIPLLAAPVTTTAPNPVGIERAARAEQAARAAAAAAKEEADKQDLLKAANIRREEQKKQEAQLRESRQPKLVEETIAKGALSADETSLLDTRLASLKKLEEQVKTTGFLTREEARQLHALLNETAREIWSDKQETEGSQLVLTRLGATAGIKSEINSQIDSGCLTRTEARAMIKDFRSLVTLRKTLSAGELADAERTARQTEYNALLNQYFTLKQPAAPTAAK